MLQKGVGMYISACHYLVWVILSIDFNFISIYGI